MQAYDTDCRCCWLRCCVQRLWSSLCLGRFLGEWRLIADIRKPTRLLAADCARTEAVSVPETLSIGFAIAGESEQDCWMFAIAFLFVRVLCDCFKSRRRLEAEVLVQRHQLNVLQQRAPHRLYLTWIDRALFVWLYRGFPRILDAITIVRPETIVRWHRKGFGAFWRWKSRTLGGRPRIDKEVRDLIRRMSFENPHECHDL